MDIKALFEDQKAKSLDLRTESYKARIKRLKALKHWILENKPRIRKAVNQDLNKSQTDIDISEIFTVTTEINHAISKLRNWSLPTYVSSGLTYLGTSAYVQYEPKGVCLIIAPWNFPFNLIGSPLVSCLAAGNTAILKPSEMTPATSALIVKMVQEVFDPNIVVAIEGGVDITTQLLGLPFDHIFFTGSTHVGKIVMKAAAENLSSVTLELGGKSPVIVDKSADISDAARKIVWGKYVNNGQTCIAPDYIFVHSEVKDKFVEAVKKCTKNMFDHADSGYKESPSYSRLVHQKHASRLVDLLDEAVRKGAQLEMGGHHEVDERYMDPTLLSNVSEDAGLWTEEVFGPILPLNIYDSLEGVIDHINKNEKPLSLYVFTKKSKIAKEVRLKTSSGTFCINDVVIQYAHPNLPFGGVNSSGIGKSHGHYGFKEFSNEKSVIKQRIGLTNALVFYPPFNSLKQKAVDFLIKYF